MFKFNMISQSSNKKKLSKPLTIISPITRLEDNEIKDNIILFTQFYIDKNEKRQNEIVESLNCNLNNSFFNKIYLLNERIYTTDEMNIIDNTHESKIEQVNIKKRLTYGDIFNYINKNNITGYIVIANSDIIFDNTLSILYKSGLFNNKKIYCQSRLEYDMLINKINKDYLESLFKITCSQDTWIFHSNFCIENKDMNKLNIMLGIPGCDNHFTYILNSLGYKIYNEPLLIKTYHNHQSNIRNYTSNEVIYKPYIFIKPADSNYSREVNNNNFLLINKKF